jgi:hypothetical protein
MKGNWSELTTLISRIFDDVKNEGSEQIQVNCPRCQEAADLPEPDGKYNLEINLRKKKFRCWKCDEPFFSGDLKYLVRLYGSTDDIKEYKEYEEHNLDVLIDEEEKVVIKDVELPDEFIPFSSLITSNPAHMEAYNYLVLDRKIPYETIIKFRLGFCLQGRYKKKIVIPSFDANGKINYYATRSYDKYAKIKHDNLKSSKDAIIFNEGYVDWDSTVYLVEGPFDFLSFNVNTIPVLGKVMGEKLFFKLKEKKPDIIVILDPDAWKNAMGLYDQLLTIYYDCEEKVKIVKMNTDKKYDLDELKRFEGITAVIEQIKEARQLKDEDYLFKKII